MLLYFQKYKMNALNFSSDSDSHSDSNEQESAQIFNEDVDNKYIRNGNYDIVF